jgi:nitrous oxidase accessory protein NosD
MTFRTLSGCIEICLPVSEKRFVINSMQARFLFPLLLIAAKASAATLAVLPETSIQSKIDAATAGDIIAIFGGTYNEDITINKAIRLVEVSGEEVILAGNVTFSGVVNPPAFEGFAVGSANKGITVNDTTGLVLKKILMRGLAREFLPRGIH